MRTDIGENPTSFRRALLGWFDRRRRNYAWRRDRDPYRIWVAEVMLQQTRIAVVEPVYERFIVRFPTIRALAGAVEDDVLSVWSGLGYYGRARSLYRAAHILHEQGKSFPRDYDEARKLPGVGAYTSAAVLSIAYGLPHAAVDGNVIRVLSRLQRWPRPGSRLEPHRSLAQRLLPVKRPGDWNQAVMELGQTVCLPLAPRCEECPLRRWCASFAAGDAERFPGPSLRRGVERVGVDLIVAHDTAGRILLERRRFPYLKDLWLPLYGETGSTRGKMIARVTHTILHRRLDVRVHCVRIQKHDVERWLDVNEGERRLFSHEELENIGRSSLLRKVLEATEMARMSNVPAIPRFPLT